jgi:hypothetical protein
MYKYIKTSHSTAHGVRTPETDGATVGLEKMSADRESQLQQLLEQGGVDPRIIEHIREADLDMDKNTYVLVVPLGASESWGPTVNGDSFERRYLKPSRDDWGHKTFELFSRAYTHHANKDRDKGFGCIPKAVYNDGMDRVEALWELWDDKAREVGAGFVIDKLKDGKNVDISMGARVPFDVCSICHNKAKSPAEYCEHVRTPGFGFIYPDTYKQVMVHNPDPLFHDLSAVIIPAAPEALVGGRVDPVLLALMRMVKSAGEANAKLVMSAAAMGEAMYGSDEGGVFKAASVGKSAAVLKLSDIIKHAPVLSSTVIEPTQRTEKVFSPDDLRKMGSGYGQLPGFLSTLGALGIVLRPREFSTAVGHSGGCDFSSVRMDPRKVKQGFDSPAEGDLVHPGGVDPMILALAKSGLGERSVFLPHLANRVKSTVIDGSRAEAKDPYGPSSTGELTDNISMLYGTYIRQLATRLSSILEHVFTTYPNLQLELLGDADPAVRALVALGGPAPSETEKVANLAAQVVLPPAYILSMAGQAADERALLEATNSMGGSPSTAYFLGGTTRS